MDSFLQVYDSSQSKFFQVGRILREKHNKHIWLYVTDLEDNSCHWVMSKSSILKYINEQVSRFNNRLTQSEDKDFCDSNRPCSLVELKWLWFNEKDIEWKKMVFRDIE